MQQIGFVEILRMIFPEPTLGSSATSQATVQATGDRQQRRRMATAYVTDSAGWQATALATGGSMGARNVKVRKIRQALVNGGSKYDPCKVAGDSTGDQHQVTSQATGDRQQAASQATGDSTGAPNVKAKKLGQARVNGGSNDDSLKVTGDSTGDSIDDRRQKTT